MNNLPFKQTKILATLGPATFGRDTIYSLIENGVNGIRLNFSHGSREERIEQIADIRAMSEKYGRSVAILQDLQGPKIRLGDLNCEKYQVKAGDELTLAYGVEHEGATIPVQYNLAQKVKVGEPVYIFDGKVQATAMDIIDDSHLKVRVENDGYIMSRKGINLPDTDFGGDILTAKDIGDIEFGADKDIDYVALSFVQSAADITDLRARLEALGSRAKIVAKIETKAAIVPEMLEQIIEASDGVMVARGDLAYEAGAEVVPVVQKTIVDLCRRYGKISIVATQMMASMVDNPRPTRAEVGDVATAVMQGADVVMLSDETANGDYPVDAVQQMRKTILYTQNNLHPSSRQTDARNSDAPARLNAISHAAVALASDVAATCIVAETKTGYTAKMISACRPEIPLLAVTSDVRVAQSLALHFGVRCFVRNEDQGAGYALAKELRSQDYFKNTSTVTAVIVSGIQPGLAGGTDTIRVRMVE